jgi:hypothetical protein
MQPHCHSPPTRPRRIEAEILLPRRWLSSSQNLFGGVGKWKLVIGSYSRQ